MQKIEELMLQKAQEYLNSGKVDKVIAWKRGEAIYDVSPATFTKDNLEGFAYNCFCGSNLSKYLVKETLKSDKILIFLKPCDTYSFNQLVAENRIDRKNVTVIGIECQGKLSVLEINKQGIMGITDVKENGYNLDIFTVYGNTSKVKADFYLEKCKSCKSKEFAVFDEQIVLNDMYSDSQERFKEVEKLEAMTAEERYNFWQEQLSKCIRCNACRNVCPACTCINCVFDNPKSGVEGKANPDSFEEKLYHIIRAFHVATRCTDCGECSRVCPQNIPLHLINRKFIKDVNLNFGEYQAGKTTQSNNPLTDFSVDDVEPNKVSEVNT